MERIVRPDPSAIKLFRATLWFYTVVALTLFIPEMFGISVLGSGFPAFLKGLFSGVAVSALVYLLITIKGVAAFRFDEELFELYNHPFSKSVKWEKLSDITLHRDHISFHYKQSGSKDYVKIPILLRPFAYRLALHLEQFSGRHGVNFNKMTPQLNPEAGPMI